MINIQEQLSKLEPVRPRQHSNYSTAIESGKLDIVFNLFSQKERLPDNTMQTINQNTKIPINTLKTWRKNVLNDPSWRPDPNRKEVNLVLGKDIEDKIADIISSKFIKQNLYCPPKTIDLFAKREHTRAPKIKYPIREFKCSYHWRQNFLKRYDLSPRKFHLKRRTEPDDLQVQIFLTEYHIAKLQFDLDLIINVDETCWRILHNGEVTIAPTGSDEVTCIFDHGEKESLTVIAGITRSGKKLPLWVLTKGVTNRCERKITENDKLTKMIREKKLYVSHSESGWTNEQIAIQYLHWLSDYCKHRYCMLIWDVYSAHRTNEVKSEATVHNISLSFIPAGQTGEWQPLDFRLFGSLKARSKARFDAQVANAALSGDQYTCDWGDALNILIEVWESIPQDEILSSWNKLEGEDIV